MRLALTARSLVRAMPGGRSRGPAGGGGGGSGSGSGSGAPTPVAAAAAKGRRAKGGPVTGSDPDRVFDKGVWKRFKYCQHCKQVRVQPLLQRQEMLVAGCLCCCCSCSCSVTEAMPVNGLGDMNHHAC